MLHSSGTSDVDLTASRMPAYPLDSKRSLARAIRSASCQSIYVVVSRSTTDVTAFAVYLEFLVFHTFHRVPRQIATLQREVNRESARY